MDINKKSWNYHWCNYSSYCCCGWHGALYEKDKTIIIVSSGATENGTFVTSVTYELVGDKLVEKDLFEKEFIDDAEWEDYFDNLNKTGKIIKVNNLFYK